MDGAQELIAGGTGAPTVEPRACPRCAEPRGPIAAAVTAFFDDLPLLRCARCGELATAGPLPHRLVLNCNRCNLPYLAEAPDTTGEGRCGDCSSHADPLDAAQPDLVEATETEVRLALDDRWRFISSPQLSLYLNRLARELARRIPGAPSMVEVLMFDDPAARTLALPSGVVLISLGALGTLEDEAQLAFLLAHELAHVASGDVSGRLVRMGLYAVSQDAGGPSQAAWARAAEELATLGFGRKREHAADSTAFEAVLDLSYDPKAVLAYLEALDERVSRGDPQVKELAVGHPPARERRMRLERLQAGWQWADFRTSPRVNREVFRRAAGHAALTGRLERPAEADATATAGERLARRPRKILWTAAGVFVLALLILLVGMLLSG